MQVLLRLFHFEIYSIQCTCISFSADPDECLTSPCKNGGSCVNTRGSYSCMCVDGWSGMDCTIIGNSE